MATRTQSPSSAAPLFELRTSAIQGRGAFAARPIRKGTRIIEYTGERIDQEEANRRYDDAAMKRHHTFLFNIDDDLCVDGAAGGNDSRFFNHSCEPNVEAFIEEDAKGEERIYLYAKRAVAAGEELTYDYAYERTEDLEPFAFTLYICKCGKPACRGTILATPRPAKKKAAAKKARGGTRTKARPRTKAGKSAGLRRGGRKAGKRAGAKR
jgi:uncharacterized protein